MKLKEKTSERLGIKYVYLPDVKKFLCENGVMFTLEEYKNGIAINDEYEKRAKEDNLYDYVYAKSTGLLRKKRGYAKISQREDSSPDRPEQSISTEDKKEVQETKIQQKIVPAEESNGLWDSMANDGRAGRWNTNKIGRAHV